MIGARAAILATNPSALVLGPEVSQHAVSDGWCAEVMDDVGDLFDIVTVHWYADGPALEYFAGPSRAAVRSRNLWLSETGIAPCASAFGEIGQALYHRRVLNAFLPRREWWTGVSFYDLRRPAQGTAAAPSREPDWSNRPAFKLYQSFIRTLNSQP